MAKKINIVTGLDIGTTKVTAVVAERTNTGIDIIGMGSHPTEGLRKGVVVNIDSTVESIRKAVEEAEFMSGVEISSVFTGISGSHIKGMNSHGIVAVQGREVEEADVRRAIDAARAISIPLDREILHVLPQHYIVDEQEGVKNPVGMAGVRLEAKVHVVTGATASTQNIVKSVNRVGLDIDEIVLEQLATAEAVLSADEKELGVALVDIGGGTTDIAVYREGSIKHTAILPIGGHYLTNDISIGLRTPVTEAEKMKIKFGCANTFMIPQSETIEVPSVGGREARKVSRQILGEIIEPRMEEIFSLVNKEFVKAGCEDRLTAGIVITGGTALLSGIAELAERIFQMPVRKGFPMGVSGLTDIINSPLHATAAGLVVYGSRRVARRGTRGGGGWWGRSSKKIKKWFSEFF